MPPETKIDCATKNIYYLARNRAICHMQLCQGIRCLRVTIFFVCHQKQHSLQPKQIYGNLVTSILKSSGVISVHVGMNISGANDLTCYYDNSYES
jgi:hypothetical protein